MWTGVVVGERDGCGCGDWRPLQRPGAGAGTKDELGRLCRAGVVLIDQERRRRRRRRRGGGEQKEDDERMGSSTRPRPGAIAERVAGTSLARAVWVDKQVVSLVLREYRVQVEYPGRRLLTGLDIARVGVQVVERERECTVCV